MGMNNMQHNGMGDGMNGMNNGMQVTTINMTKLELVNREIIWKIKIREKDKHDDNSSIPDERDGEPKHDESRDEGDDEHEQRNAGINLSFLSFLN